MLVLGDNLYLEITYAGARCDGRPWVAMEISSLDRFGGYTYILPITLAAHLKIFPASTVLEDTGKMETAFDQHRPCHWCASLPLVCIWVPWTFLFRVWGYLCHRTWSCALDRSLSNLSLFWLFSFYFRVHSPSVTFSELLNNLETGPLIGAGFQCKSLESLLLFNILIIK